MFSQLSHDTITIFMGKLSPPCTLYCKKTMRSAPEARGSPLEGGAEVTSPGGLTWKDGGGEGEKK